MESKDLGKFRRIAVTAFIAVFVVFLVIYLLSSLFPELLKNTNLVFGILIAVVLLCAVIAFPLFMKKIRQYETSSAAAYMKDIKSIPGFDAEYYFEGEILLSNIYNDPSTYPWFSTNSRSEHMIKGTYGDMKYMASNLGVYKNRYDGNRYNNKDYSFRGYYILVSDDKLPVNFKAHVRTYNYFKASPGDEHNGGIEIGNRQRKWKYDVVQALDPDFNKKLIVTSNSQTEAQEVLLNNSRFRDVLLKFAKETDDEFAIFFHGDGRVGLALPNFTAFDFGLQGVDEEKTRKIIDENILKVKSYLELIGKLTETIKLP